MTIYRLVYRIFQGFNPLEIEKSFRAKDICVACNTVKSQFLQNRGVRVMGNGNDVLIESQSLLNREVIPTANWGLIEWLAMSQSLLNREVIPTTKIWAETQTQISLNPF